MSEKGCREIGKDEERTSAFDPLMDIRVGGRISDRPTLFYRIVAPQLLGFGGLLSVMGVTP